MLEAHFYREDEHRREKRSERDRGSEKRIHLRVERAHYRDDYHRRSYQAEYPVAHRHTRRHERRAERYDQPEQEDYYSAPQRVARIVRADARKDYEADGEEIAQEKHEGRVHDMQEAEVLAEHPIEIERGVENDHEDHHESAQGVVKLYPAGVGAFEKDAGYFVFHQTLNLKSITSPSRTT